LQVTAGNAEIISQQLAEIMLNLNSGNGTLGRLIMDTTIAESFNQTMVNLQKSSKGLDENMKAAKGNFLLRGYYKKKEKAAEEAKTDALEKKDADQKETDKKKSNVIESKKEKQ
jgi:phospholipid/cholesterol/gamma-HCH transport system substrate-binding protein